MGLAMRGQKRKGSGRSCGRVEHKDHVKRVKAYATLSDKTRTKEPYRIYGRSLRKPIASLGESLCPGKTVKRGKVYIRALGSDVTRHGCVCVPQCPPDSTSQKGGTRAAAKAAVDSVREQVGLIRLVVLTRGNVRLEFNVRDMQVSVSSRVNDHGAGALRGDNARWKGTTVARAASI